MESPFSVGDASGDLASPGDFGDLGVWLPGGTTPITLHDFLK